MKRIILLAILIAITLPSFACYKTQVVVSPDYDPAARSPSAQVTRVHILGLVPAGGDINAREHCRSGVGVVETEMVLKWALISVGRVNLYCANPRADREVEEELAGM